MADHDAWEHYNDCVTCFENVRATLIWALRREVDPWEVHPIVQNLFRWV